jgi:hypothetical protein
LKEASGSTHRSHLADRASRLFRRRAGCRTSSSTLPAAAAAARCSVKLLLSADSRPLCPLLRDPQRCVPPPTVSPAAALRIFGTEYRTTANYSKTGNSVALVDRTNFDCSSNFRKHGNNSSVGNLVVIFSYGRTVSDLVWT